MSELIRLVYASRSTFTRSAQHQGLDPGVARILAKSRKNNARRQIVGGLLFGDGCFLQCLEGQAHAVESLYGTIASDDRHTDVKVLLRRKISQRSFGAWSMKYVPGELVLADCLRSWGTTRFDPYGLTDEQIAAAVELMRRGDDPVDTLPSAFDDSPAREPAREQVDSMVSVLRPSSGSAAAGRTASIEGGGARVWVGVLAIAALGGVAAAYWRFG